MFIKLSNELPSFIPGTCSTCKYVSLVCAVIVSREEQDYGSLFSGRFESYVTSLY